MPKFDRQAWLFSINSFAAAMLALFIGFSVGLPRPYWAMTTAFIISQPLSGAVRSKAVYRVLGTLLGGAAAVVMVPNLVNSPPLLCLALALWVGFCLTVSLLDRTPRSYVMMLAGYTAAIIGFPSVLQPDAIFDVAVARVVEIGLGIVCATLTHSLIFPRSVSGVLCARLGEWLGEADHWALDLLRGEQNAPSTIQVSRDRRHLAVAASEIGLLASHLPFDTSRLRDTTDAVRVLHDRMLLMIPILSGIADRLAALRVDPAGLPPTVGAWLDAVIAWIEAGANPDVGASLAQGIDADLGGRPPADWRGLLAESLLTRLSQLVVALGEAHGLLAHLAAPDAPVAPPLKAAIAGAVRRPMHADPRLALLSGGSASLALLLVCAIWIGTGWADGAGAAALTAVFCSFFAAQDDPAPAIVSFGLFTGVAIPIAAIYAFFVLPQVDGFAALTLALAPPLLFLGLYMHDPRRAGAATATILGICNGLALQERFSSDFAGFINTNLAQFVGLFAAIFVTRTLRSMSVDASARRLMRQTWRALARMARAREAPDPADFGARLVDRLGLLAPKLALPQAGDPVEIDILQDLRIGMNIVTLQQARPELPATPRAAVDDLLAGVGDHFARLSAGHDRAPGPEVLGRLDRALGGVIDQTAEAARACATGLVGLRRNLFPKAAAFIAPPTGAPEPGGAAG